MADLARLILLLIFAAILWNVANGTGGAWFRSKFLGRPPQRPASSSSRAPSSRPGTLPAPGVQV